MESNLSKGNFTVIREAAVHGEALQGAGEELLAVGERSVEVRDNGVVERRTGGLGELDFQADELLALLDEGGNLPGEMCETS